MVDPQEGKVGFANSPLSQESLRPIKEIFWWSDKPKDFFDVGFLSSGVVSYEDRRGLRYPGGKVRK